MACRLGGEARNDSVFSRILTLPYRALQPATTVNESSTAGIIRQETRTRAELTGLRGRLWAEETPPPPNTGKATQTTTITRVYRRAACRGAACAMLLGHLAVGQIDARVAVESLHGCWPGDKCDFACALRNIRASCGDEGVGMVPQSLMLHDGSPVCQWCSDIADDTACGAAYFVDFWQGALGAAAIIRCTWQDEEGTCRGLEPVKCGPRSSPPPPYPPLFSIVAAPPPSVLMLRYADGGGAISAAQPSPPPPATLLNALELRAYRGGQIVANASRVASLTAAHGIKTASGVLASSVVPMLASTMVGEVEHVLVAGEQAAQTQNASLLLFAIPVLSCCCCLALCCLLSRYRRIRVAEDHELESALGSPPGSPRDAAARPEQHKKKLARTVGRGAKHRYEFK